jgi:glycosyltransferase involved in cell wall biosynthesis
VAGLPFGLPQPPHDREQKPAGISLCMIVKNEERFLEQCLKSAAAYVDEICIVDTGSTDRTIEIARSFGAKIEEREWRSDFGWARNEALAMATKRWILQLDADEELLPASRAALSQLRAVPADRTGLWVRCHNAADDYAGTGTMSHSLVRIFPNDAVIRYKGRIHEFATIDDSQTGISAVHSPVAIVHHGYLKDVIASRNKAQRNLEIVREATLAEPDDPFHWFNLGMTAHIMGDAPTARDAFEKMLQVNGDRPRGFMANGLSTLADIYTEKFKEPARALEIARRCLVFAPNYANAHFSIGKAYVEMGRLPEARAAYEDAIADGKFLAKQFVVDDEVPAWKAQCEIGTTFVMEGDDTSALAWFDRGIANRPSAHPIRLNRARTLDRMQRYAEAEKAFAELYDEFGDEQTTTLYVNFLLRRHQELKAVDVIERSARRFSARAAVSMLLAAFAVAEKFGWSDAARFLDEARTIDAAILEELRPSWNDDVRQYEAALEAARRGNASGEALECAKRVRPQSGEIYEKASYLRAVLLAQDARDGEALEALDSLKAVNERHVLASLLRAQIFERARRFEDAVAVLEDARSFGGERADVELAALYLRMDRVADAVRVADRALA